MSQSDEKIVETKKSSVSNPFASDKSALKESNAVNVESKPVDGTHDIVNPFASTMSVLTEHSHTETNEKPIVNPFLQKNSTLNIPDKSEHTPIYYAKIKGYHDIYKLLLENGAKKPD